MTSATPPRRPAALVLAGAALSALLAGSLASAAASAHPAALPAAAHPGHPADAQGPLRARNAFQDQMRKLWEDHITWTRLAIVTFADGSPGFPATADRLLQNQRDIGEAITPYYGAAAGERLTALLREHITTAVEVLQAAKAGDTHAFEAALGRWYDNGNAIADFLSAANPRSWPDPLMRADMKAHLDQTLAEADHELHGRYAASVTDYEAIHTHILMMADQLSSGIVAQFPAAFR